MTAVSTVSFGKVKQEDDLQCFKSYSSNLNDLLALLISQEKNPLDNWKGTDDSSILHSDKPHTWFPHDDAVVFHEGSSRQTTTYAQLYNFIQEFPRYSSNKAQSYVVAILLPTYLMAETAVTLLSVMAQQGLTNEKTSGVCAAPLDPNMTAKQLENALLQLQCKALITTKDIWESGVVSQVSHEIKENQLEDIRLLKPKPGSKLVGEVEFTFVKQAPNLPEQPIVDSTLSSAINDSATAEELPILLLRTSGTTSQPKVVPLRPSNLVYNAVCIAASLGLSRSDIDLNAMPLYHIGGISCALLAVVVSGSGVMFHGPFQPQSFLNALRDDDSNKKDLEQQVIPTWYYGVPTMHKSLALTIQHEINHQEMDNEEIACIPNRLRFVRSGAAHLSHDLAMELSRLLNTTVLPTYSMSECMPICSSSNPVRWNEEATVLDSVGQSIGPSLKIVDPETGSTVPFGSDVIGEVCLKGPGVIKAYIGSDVADTHTPDGWLCTGDMGVLDREGRVFLKGRRKEMIKRGGEQIWPNEIDDVVGAVDGVATAVAFGVPNDMWGEEVAVAVVLQDYQPSVMQVMQGTIIEACKRELSPASVPKQIAFLDSTDRLLKGPTGKYLRTRMADHLRVKAVDFGAVKALEASLDMAVEVEEDVKHVAPSDALNGLRFLVAMNVVQVHAGLMPFGGWAKLQSYSLNMIIFFAIGALQLAATTKGNVSSSWGVFVGTKIGTLHAFFLISQLVAIPSMLLFECGSRGYLENFDNTSCSDPGFTAGFVINLFLATFLTPFGTFNPVNGVTWFQAALYWFIIVFPCLHHALRIPPGTQPRQRSGYWIGAAVATFVAPTLGIALFPLLMYNFIGWFPHLVISQLIGYRFSSKAVNTTDEERRRMGYYTDILSFLLLLVAIAVVLSPPSCVSVPADVYAAMRPDDVDFSEGDVTVCDLTFDEFTNYMVTETRSGRYGTDLGGILGFIRYGTPLALLWLYCISYGAPNSITIKLFTTKVMLWLSPLAYPLYLLHGPVLKYYWLLTRGYQAEQWWRDALGFPVPIDWYEVFVVIVISTLLGWVIERTLVPIVMPFTTKAAIAIATKLECCCCCRRYTYDEDENDLANIHDTSSAYGQVAKLVAGLTGAKINRDMNLSDLGLDSLGASALLSTLQVAITSARSLTMRQLSEFATIGDLVDFLESKEGPHQPASIEL